jgi:hypothetical protein
MLNPIEEAKFDELKSMCRALRVPAPPEIMIGLKVHDRDGVLTFDDVQRGHSWTRNFWNWFYSITTDSPGDASGLFGAGKMSEKQVDGTIYSSATYGCGRYLNAELYAGTGYFGELNSTAQGIVVGTSDTAFSVEQYGLIGLIESGVTAGLLSYQASIKAVATYTGTTWKATHVRIFNNNSGGSITVKEAGLHFYALPFNSNPFSTLFERSVLSPTVAVANGAQLTVTYQISMDFSAID